jgi:hypothetical protein
MAGLRTRYIRHPARRVTACVERPSCDARTDSYHRPFADVHGLCSACAQVHDSKGALLIVLHPRNAFRGHARTVTIGNSSGLHSYRFLCGRGHLGDAFFSRGSTCQDRTNWRPFRVDRVTTSDGLNERERRTKIILLGLGLLGSPRACRFSSWSLGSFAIFRWRRGIGEPRLHDSRARLRHGGNSGPPRHRHGGGAERSRDLDRGALFESRESSVGAGVPLRASGIVLAGGAALQRRWRCFGLIQQSPRGWVRRVRLVSGLLRFERDS